MHEVFNDPIIIKVFSLCAIIIIAFGIGIAIRSLREISKIKKIVQELLKDLKKEDIDVKALNLKYEKFGITLFKATLNNDEMKQKDVPTFKVGYNPPPKDHKLPPSPPAPPKPIM